MNKQQLSEALVGMATALPSDADSYAFHGALAEIVAAARLVERLLPGECQRCDGAGVEAFIGASTMQTGESVFYPCPVCHGSGRVWDEGTVEAVAKYLGEFAHFSEDRARGVLAVLVELLTEKVET